MNIHHYISLKLNTRIKLFISLIYFFATFTIAIFNNLLIVLLNTEIDGFNHYVTYLTIGYIISIFGTLFINRILYKYSYKIVLSYVFIFLFFSILLACVLISISIVLVNLIVMSSIKFYVDNNAELVSFYSFLSAIQVFAFWFGYQISSLVLSLILVNQSIYIISLLLFLSFIFVRYSKVPMLYFCKISQHNFSFKQINITALYIFVPFLISILAYKSFGNGLKDFMPIINKLLLGVDLKISFELTSLFVISLFSGRIVFSLLTKIINPMWLFITFSLITIFLLGYISLNDSIVDNIHLVSTWSQIPIIGYCLPFIGFFSASTEPFIKSMMLAKTSKSFQQKIAALIIVATKLGSLTGVVLIGRVLVGSPANYIFELLLVLFIITFISALFYIRFDIKINN